MSFISKSESVISVNLSLLNIIADATSRIKSKFDGNDNLFINGAFQPYRFFNRDILNMMNTNLPITVRIKIKMTKNIIANNLHIYQGNNS